MHYKVSVIVPVHNVAPYIELCANSLFNQTLEELQFVFVNDHTEDNSMEILERLLDAYPNRRPHTVFLTLEEERGIPAARKAGQAQAQGEFFAHCDSDDYVDPDMYETLYNAAIAEQADIVECEFWEGFEGFSRHRHHKEFGSKNYVVEYLKGKIWAYVWPRIAHSSLCGKVDFSTCNYLEDWYMSVQLMHHARRVAVVRQPLYHYCLNWTSVTHMTSPDNFESQFNECKENYRLMHDYVVRNLGLGEEAFLLKKVKIKARSLPLLASTGNRLWRRVYLDTFPEVNWHLLFSLDVPKERKTEFLAVEMGVYPLMDRLRRVYRTLIKA